VNVAFRHPEIAFRKAKGAFGNPRDTFARVESAARRNCFNAMGIPDSVDQDLVNGMTFPVSIDQILINVMAFPDSGSQVPQNKKPAIARGFLLHLGTEGGQLIMCLTH
jgi:hypothetical protein